ncbi:Hypothetical protein R9X50_00601300 [Acrodontium crateriforme]|uniref:Uncharacterized protein n=1 Tax=Acrodontium crateriforme TaxID=150365 RepID=A0AAQ3M968_9PEZI|nr:Hypothetical protein R9X50_00601300 [Acrodontium crateriforme]
MPLLLRRRSGANLLKTTDNSDQSPADALQPVSKLHADPATIPRPRSEHGLPASRLSHQLQPEEVDSEPAITRTSRSRVKRFSLGRNQSEPRMPTRGSDGTQDELPPLPTTSSVPAIVKTAPTMELGQYDEDLNDENTASLKPSLFARAGLGSRIKDTRKMTETPSPERVAKRKSKSTTSRWRRMQGRNSGLEDLHRLSTMMSAQQSQNAPPSYGDESNSALALPVPRFSESSQSDGSNASSGEVYGTTTTTTHTVSTHTTFFKLPRRNRNRNSLFPLPPKTPPGNEYAASSSSPATPRPSTSAFSTKSARLAPAEVTSAPHTVLQRRHTESVPNRPILQHPPLPASHAALAKSASAFADPGTNVFRPSSQRSRASSSSIPSLQTTRKGARDRASTTSSWGRTSHDLDTPPGLSGSGRNSISTTGRQSLGGFLTLSRFRQSSEPHSPRHGSPGTRSKSNSFALSREMFIPVREEGDTPGKYLERLEAAVARSMIAGILSKSSDPFALTVLRSYTRRFPFFGEPIDMSLRKFLLEAELPKETQQVDRVLQAFADRYHECNPGIFISPDKAYIIAFSLMMLHTDAFNKNNKRKMQKPDYIKNTSGQHVSDDVLACFYDNICYTPFVHYEEEVDINGERVLPFKPKKSKLKGAIGETGVVTKKPTGPVDPYNLLVEQRLDVLRPPIKDTITLDDPYNYRGSQVELDSAHLQRAFTHTGILQIISARSRPAAYEGRVGTDPPPNPVESQAGIVDLKITKVGTLWRKATKRKKTRSPWQEWGAILTGSQLYLFKNAHWAKGLLNQFTSQQKPGQPRTPVIFKPPISDFKPDALIKTDNAVALVDSTYTRHKHAFTFFRSGGQEEVLLADNENELNDWLALINYAAAFRAAGVRIRGMVGGNEENLRARELNRLSSSSSQPTSKTSSPLADTISSKRMGLSPQLQRQVMAARRQIMVQKISELERDIAETVKQLDSMVRNARHLLILAPIAPKARDDVIHGAAKADATIKWIRRDIWRMKCHRDILALDVQQDGVTAAELFALTADQPATPLSTETQTQSKKNAGDDVVRAGSKASAARSPPQSPVSAAIAESKRRPSGTSSIDTFMAGDVFRTVPETAPPQHNNENEGYRLPPLQLDIDPRAKEHRGSIASTLLSVSSPGQSLSHASSTSSVGRIERLETPSKSEVDSTTGAEAQDETQIELLARATMPLSNDVTSVDGVSPNSATPESGKHKSVRRSLHKTLRDVHHPGSHHKHRRGRDSDGTIRSAAGLISSNAAQTGANSADASENAEMEGTPGLQREKGRFILHGKQASVIQFGSDWDEERMKARQEKWAQAAAEEAGPSAAINTPDRRPSNAMLAGLIGSPIVHEFTRESMDTDRTAPNANESAEDSGDDDLDAESEHDDPEAPSTTCKTAAEPESLTTSPTSQRRRTVIGPPQIPLPCAFPTTDGDEEISTQGTSVASD